MTPDFKELLRIFNENGVRYLLVGAYAVMIYSEPQFTKDLDIWVDATVDNSAKVFDSLKAFGAPLEGLSPDDFASSGFFQMGRSPIRIDILMSVYGLDFESAWRNRKPGDFDGIRVNYLGRDDLITNKKESARPQDLLDLESINLSKPRN